MHEKLSEFLEHARNIRLSKPESDDVKTKIQCMTEKYVREKPDRHLKGRMDQKTLLGTAKNIRLSTQESDDVRTHVMRYANEHPVRLTEGWFALPSPPGPLELIRSFFSPLRLKPALSMIVGLCIAFGGTLSVAAQSALPGDFLYGVKVNVNENIAAALHFSANARAEYETQRLENRLSEAATLVTSGRLKGGLESNASANITTQLERVQHSAKALSESGDANAALDVHSQVESMLNANAAVLGLLEHNNGQNTESDVHNLLKNVSEAENHAMQLRVESEKKVSAEEKADTNARAAAGDSITSAINTIDDIRGFIDRSSASTNGQILAQANARIVLAEKLLGTARSSLDAGNFDEAFQLSRTAVRTAREARIMLKVSAGVQAQLKITPTPSVEEEKEEKSSTEADERIDDSMKENNARSTGASVQGDAETDDIEIKTDLLDLKQKSDGTVKVDLGL